MNQKKPALMQRQITRPFLLGITLLASTWVTGCNGSQPSTQQTVQPTKPGQKAVQAEMTDTAATQIAVTRKNQQLHYNVTTTVTSGCYSEGDVKQSMLDSTHTVLDLEIRYQPGFCTQALKQLHFEGMISDADKKINTVTTNITDLRSGNVIQKIVPVNDR